MLPDTARPTSPLSDAFVAPADPAALYAHISHLLTTARAEHLAKKHAAGRANKAGHVTIPPNYVKAEQHIRQAVACREEAERLDPEHTAPAWREDLAANKGQTNQTLLAWMRHYLTIP